MNDLKFTTAEDYMKDGKCEVCGREYHVTCDWRQGRCPHHPVLIDNYRARYYNLIKTIKGWFNR
jgi:hypothetical protein